MKKVITTLVLILSTLLSISSCEESTKTNSSETEKSFTTEKSSNSINDESETSIENSVESSETSSEESSESSALDVNEFLKSQKAVVFHQFDGGIEQNYWQGMIQLGEKRISGRLLTLFDEFNNDEIYCVSFVWTKGNRAEIDKTFIYDGKTYPEIDAEIFPTEDRIPNEEALEKYKEAREMYFNLCLKSEIDYLTECGFICVEKNENCHAGTQFLAYATEEQILNFECFPDRQYIILPADVSWVSYDGDNIIRRTFD